MDAELRIHQGTWVLGGVLLLVATLLQFSTASFSVVMPGIATVSVLVFGVACIVFAVGARRDASVTARQPVGTLALILLGAWTPVAAIVHLTQAAATLQTLQVFSTIDAVVSFALSLVAVVSIGRARTLPAPWNWAPAACLAAVTAVRVIDAALVAVPPVDAPTVAPIIALVAALIGAGSALGLGVVAVVLGTHPQRSPHHPTTSAVHTRSAR